MHFTTLATQINQDIQQTLITFRENAQGKSELERIQLAIVYCNGYNQPIPLLPAVPQRQDFWYLVQLYALGNHVHWDTSRYEIRFDISERVSIPDRKTNDALIHQLVGTTDGVSRNQIDTALSSKGDDIVKDIGKDPQEYRLSLMPLDIYLQLDIKQNDPMIFIDGYRRRTDGKLMSLYGGDKLFGGHAYIDSLWMDMVNTDIYPQLTIIPRNHGHI